jgi:hypothetical protein
MSQNTIIISAQTFENYSDTETPHWKPKGEQTFSLQTDTDSFLYGEDTCIKAIKTLLERQSNTMFRYEYRGYDIIFHEPVVLDSAEFETELDIEFAKIKD